MKKQTNSVSPWFFCYLPRPDAKARIFCFPHGGGGPQAYIDWAKKLPEEIEVMALCLPGRSMRFKETLLTKTDDIVSRVSEEITSYMDKPFAFFGHSTGALWAFETARELRKKRASTPFHLMVSALPAPDMLFTESPLYPLPDDELAHIITQWGLLPNEIIQNSELLDMILPPLRADFEASERYRYVDATQPDIPITAFGGKKDEQVPEHHLKAWAEYTSGDFSLKLFNGGHFYTETCQELVLESVAKIVEKELKSIPLSIFEGEKEAYPLHKCLHELFREQVAKTPDQLAVVGKEQELTFRELDEKTDLLAKYLVSKGSKVDSMVGIYMETSLEYVIAYIAILKAAGAYMPMEIEYPADLIQKVLKTAEPVSVLTNSGYFDKLPKEWRDAGKAFRLDKGWEDALKEETFSELNKEQSPDSLAYCVLTSGTTGDPKGILCPHKGAVNSYYWRYTHYPYEEGEREACNIFFVWEAIRSILQGRPSYVIPDEVIYDPFRLADFICEHKITRILFTPSLLEQILDIPDLPIQEKLASLKIVYLNGEVVPTRLRDRFVESLPHITLLNDYSISETHDVCTTDLKEINREISPKYAPIGKPMANVRLSILDENLAPVPRGASGEVYVGGESIARGYLKEPEKTKERFVPDPVRKDGSILFRTGDMGRALPDGNVELSGRMAFMIKLRGHSVVPGAVEAAITEHPDISVAVVVPKNDNTTGQPEYLAAYIITDAYKEDIGKELRSFLRSRLPNYAIPSLFIPMEKLPLHDVTGKLDRKKLPDPDRFFAESKKKKQKVGITTDVGKNIASVWKSLLNVGEIDPADNFFDLGGHSLLAIQSCRRLSESSGYEISVTDIYGYPTLSLLAEHISQKRERAHVVDSNEPQAPKARDDSGEIAVIGISCRFPDAESVEEFWENLRTGRNSISKISEETLKQRGIDEKIYTKGEYKKFGAFLKNIDKFDPDFWNISRKEAKIMDPQHRIFLECCFTALENAGYAPMQNGARTGVFGGCYLPLYLIHYLHCEGIKTFDNPSEFHMTETGNDKDYLATRVSYLLNLRGPSISVQTACSTSLVTVATACNALLARQCDMALAGASSLILPQEGYHYMEGHICSKDGVVRAYDAHADGTILGDGAGVVVLKRLSDAISDRDTILAVIKGYAVNNDGNMKAGYSAPSVQGQVNVISDALSAAGVNPDTISFVEGHGTGTLIGDPIEVKALTEVFGKQTGMKNFCALGSVKSNIGHSNISAGMASLIKTLLALQHKEIPPVVNFTTPNPEMDIENSPFYINQDLKNWKKTGDAPRRAGVTCLGIGGTNCHMTLEEAPERYEKSDTKRDEYILTLSAKSENSLERARTNLLDYLKENPDANIGDIEYTLHTGREEFDRRLAISCSDMPSAIEKLSNAQLSETPDSDNSLARRWVTGSPVDWEEYHKGEIHFRVNLPGYSFEREKCWADNKKFDPVAPDSCQKESDQMLPPDERLYIPSWKQTAIPSAFESENKERWLILEDSPEKKGLGNLIAAKLSEKEQSASHIFMPNSSDYQDYIALFDRLSQQKKFPQKIVCLRGLTREVSDTNSFYYNILNLAKALAESHETGEIMLWLITDKAVRVMDEPLCLEKSLIFGPSLVLGQENPNIESRVIDIEMSSQPEKLAERIVNECGYGYEPLVALRGDSRWALEYESIKLKKKEKPKNKGVYIITGGLGRIGLALAKRLADEECRIILTTRSDVRKEKRGEKLQKMIDTGADILVLRANMASAKDVTAIFEKVERKFGRIDGIFHAAGLADLKYMHELTYEHSKKEFESKVSGLLNLESVIRERDKKPEFVVLFSSLASILGGFKMAAYAAANRFMDTFAQSDPYLHGVRWISINWDDWDFEYGKEQVSVYEKTGKEYAISPDECIEALWLILGNPSLTRVALSGRGLDQRIEKWLHRKSEINDSVVMGGETLEQRLADLYAKALDVSEIHPDSDFFDIGGDSILASQILLQIQRIIPESEGIRLHDIFECPTVGKLAARLERTKR